MAGKTAGHAGETPKWLLRCFDWYDGLVNGRGDRMEPMDAHKRDLESRFDSVGWGLLFLFFAALAIPHGTAEYVAVAIIGGLMLLLNAIRVTVDVPVRWFSVILGSAMLAAGVGAMTGVHMDFFALVFVVAGVVTIGGALLRPTRKTAG